MAKQKTFVDLGFWGGVVPGNDKDLKEMVRHGVVGFKCFLCPSGVPEFEAVSEEDVDKALVQLKGTGSVLAVIKDPYLLKIIQKHFVLLIVPC